MPDSIDGKPPHRTPLREVAGKVAFVTGGNSGIGLGISHALARAGMKVVITWRTQKNLTTALKLLEFAAGRIHAVHVDVTDRHGMRRAADETLSVFGKVHCLINNAGVGVISSLRGATDADWDWCMNVNVTGVFNGVHAFLPHIEAHGEGGQIVTTASMSGLFVGATAGLYSTAKFAVVGMMEALRNELKDSDVGVSVYCPGAVNTNIHFSNRNHPARDETPLGEPMTTGMDPLEAGEHVLRGIRNNDLYILSHPEFAHGIRDRNEALVASIPRDLPPPPASRLALEEVVLRTSIYGAERDRKL